MASSSPFRFQRFTVLDDQCGMKIGTDAVLLGAWANVNDCSRILDIGTGCGIIALMLAQRTEDSSANIEAIEIEREAAEQSRVNFANSPWPDRLTVHPTSLKDFATDQRKGQYDLCVCNPPYFDDSTPSTKPKTRIARHTTELTRIHLLASSNHLLTENGMLCIVLPMKQTDSTITLARQLGFHLHEKTLVRPLPSQDHKRTLLSFGLTKQAPQINELCIENRRHEFSKQYELLTHKFHLRFA